MLMEDLRMIRRVGGDNARMVEFGSEEGSDYATLHYYGFGGNHTEPHAILYIGTSKRREGTGRRLLELAIADAKARDAKTLYGEIVSREGLEFFLGVLGAEYVDVRSVGDFNADPYDVTQPKTRALLAYPLVEQFVR
jgi:hypothetical protein